MLYPVSEAIFPQSQMAAMIHEVARRYPDRPCTRVKIDGAWIAQNYSEFIQDIDRVAAWLLSQKIEIGDRVAIFSGNCPEWSVSDFAVLSVGAISVPIYHTLHGEQLAYILRDSGAKLIFVAGADEARRVVACLDRDSDQLPMIVVFSGLTELGDLPKLPKLKIFSYPDILAKEASEASQKKVKARIDATTGRACCSIIYTSGTTGDPKGVMLSHEGFKFESRALDKYLNITCADISLSFLPLSHALERSWSWVVFSHGGENVYVQDPRKIAEYLPEVKPTLMVSVPRLYEKVYLAAREKVAGSPKKQKIFDWALRVGGQCQRAYRKGKTPNRYWLMQLPLADALVLKNIRNAMGGAKNVMACGGAPLRIEIEEFFSACGMLILNGYGLTEASPLISFNAPNLFKLGTCGPVIHGGEVKIGADGEILYRGDNVMMGYWNQPEETKKVIDADGWLHTGDVGYVDTDDFLMITDRLKDLIITSGGKNIAPAPIEGLVLADPLFENAVLIGDNRPYLTMLVSPSLPALKDLSNALQVQWEKVEDLFTNPKIVAEIKDRIANMTTKLAKHEQIKDLRVILQDFSTENGLLTPTLKVKRKEVEKRFAKLIDEMYSRVWPTKEGHSDSENPEAKSESETLETGKKSGSAKEVMKSVVKSATKAASKTTGKASKTVDQVAAKAVDKDSSAVPSVPVSSRRMSKRDAKRVARQAARGTLKPQNPSS